MPNSLPNNGLYISSYAEGNNVVYILHRDEHGNYRSYYRSLDKVSIRPIKDPERPVISPDSDPNELSYEIIIDDLYFTIPHPDCLYTGAYSLIGVFNLFLDLINSQR